MNLVTGDHSATLMGSVTSLTLEPSGRGLYAATDESNLYYLTLPSLAAELRGTCHYERINDVIFPSGCDDLFLTCSKNDIRVWNTRQKQEVLRIQVPNLECHCIQITQGGGTILSGWEDGKIRAFYPESGRLKFVINDAHQVSAYLYSNVIDVSKCIHDTEGVIQMT